MEDQALSVALKAMRKGQCIVILDSKCREIETNLFFLIAFFFSSFSKKSKDCSMKGNVHLYGS